MDTLSANDRTQVLQDATRQFWTHITPIVKIAFALHVVFFLLFLVLDVTALLVTNLFSMPAYVACLACIRRKHYRLAGMIMSVEIIVHACVATWILGWESNFYLYVFCLLPIVAFSFQTAPVRRIGLNLAIVTMVVSSYILRDRMHRDTGISPALLNGFGIANVLTASCLLIHATTLSVRFTLSMQYSLFHSAYRDSLTNLYTRRRVLQRVRQLAERPSGKSIAIVLLDVDHFKLINDRHGHDYGDVILQRVADVVMTQVRSTDLAARWGGEEFLILMPDTSLDEALQIADRVLQRTREWAGQVDKDPHEVTATLAVVTIEPGQSFRDALNQSDRLLYLGKQQGRDRVMSIRQAYGAP
ncbi:diguanylate cyclase [Pseudomonas sp. nanlin1]|uniref:diguanylate cyclase n=1 Tax=Pseudomonas sp. nanlin1 TaxID=3040605 RepID=UPI00388F606F